jgi:preprotein translocase subunit SecE
VARPVVKRETNTPILKRDNVLRRTVRETTAELRKVVWPTRDEAVKLTTIVVITIIAMSLFFGGIDYILTRLVQILLAR